jgi:hypothetical protein
MPLCRSIVPPNSAGPYKPVSQAMRSHTEKSLASLVLACLLAAPAAAQQTAAPANAATPPRYPARDLTMSKCFQCHTDTMWRDQRLDARGWEATLYRMVARGALWSGDDIKTMARYLATDFGPQSPKAAPVSH